MVTVRRCRGSGKSGPDSTVRRCRQALLYTARRCNRGPLYTARRCKGCVFQWHSVAIGASPKQLLRADVVRRMSIEHLPSHREPRGFVGPASLDGLMNKAGLDEFTQRTGNDVIAPPTALGQVGGRGQKTPVVVADELPGNLHEQRARRVAQSGVCRAIQDSPWQGYKPAGIAPRATLVARVALVHCNAVPWGSASR